MVEVRECPDEVWDELALRDPSCTFFQTRRWYSIVAPFAGGKPSPLLFDFGSAIAVLPLGRRKKFGWDFFQSPFGTYTAVLCGETLTQAQIREITGFLGKKNILLFSSPITRNPTPVGRVTENATFMIELDSLNADDVTTAWAKNQKRYLRKGQEAGIRVRRAESEEDVARYLKIYEMSIRRWDKKIRGRYPDALFEKLWGELRDSDSMRFWLAEIEGRIIGGDICFYHNRHAVQWHGVVDPDFFNAGTNQTLLRHIISDAAQGGFAYYDMNPSGGLENVEKFKRDFGSRRIGFQNYENRNRIYSLLRSAALFMKSGRG